MTNFLVHFSTADQTSVIKLHSILNNQTDRPKHCFVSYNFIIFGNMVFREDSLFNGFIEKYSPSLFHSFILTSFLSCLLQNKIIGNSKNMHLENGILINHYLWMQYGSSLKILYIRKDIVTFVLCVEKILVLLIIFARDLETEKCLYLWKPC